MSYRTFQVGIYLNTVKGYLFAVRAPATSPSLLVYNVSVSFSDISNDIDLCVAVRL